MASDRSTLKRLYLRFRHPKVFIISVCVFISTMLGLHYFFGIDSDWGGTNLTLSCEASVASAVVTVAAEETIRLLKIVLERIAELFAYVKKRFSEIKLIVIEIKRIAEEVHSLMEMQDKTLRGVLLIAEAQRDMLLDHRALLQALKDGDERILKALTEGDRNGVA